VFHVEHCAPSRKGGGLRSRGRLSPETLIEHLLSCDDGSNPYRVPVLSGILFDPFHLLFGIPLSIRVLGMLSCGDCLPLGFIKTDNEGRNDLDFELEHTEEAGWFPARLDRQSVRATRPRQSNRNRSVYPLGFYLKYTICY
jgi:hypothetical protein